jgi:hypothetical protein
MFIRRGGKTTCRGRAKSNWIAGAGAEQDLGIDCETGKKSEYLEKLREPDGGTGNHWM